MGINSTIASAVAKIIELDDKIAINGQLYDKATLKPYPMEFFFGSINANGNAGAIELQIKRRICYESYKATRMHPYQNQYIVDCNDPTIVYQLYDFDTRYNRSKLFKLKKNDNNYDVIGERDFYGYYHHEAEVDIIGQTQKYILFKLSTVYDSIISNPYYSRHSYTFIVKMDKVTMATTTIYSTYYSSQPDEQVCDLHVLEMNENYIYIGGKILGVNTTTVSRIDINLNTVINLYSGPSIYLKSSFVKLGGSFYTLINDPAASNVATSYYMMLKLTINENGTAISEILPIDTNGYQFFFNDPNAYIFGDIYYNNVVHYLNYIDDTHICVTISEYMGKWQLSRPAFHKNVVLKYDTVANKFIATDMISLSLGCRGVLPYRQDNNAKMIVCLMKNGFTFYQYNDMTEKYTEVYAKGGNYTSIGFDSLNRFWAKTVENSIEVMSYLSPTTLAADFELDGYKIDNVDIKTKVKFYAKNYDNEFVRANVTLTILGDAIFDSTGTKYLSTVTSDTGIAEVPATIRSYGRLEVLITETV